MSCINCYSSTNSSTNLFVKGFVQNKHYDSFSDPSECTGEFFVIVTDLKTSKPIPIISANKDGDNWIVECTNGQILTLAQEPSTPRHLAYAKLVKNFKKGFSGIIPDTYDEVLPCDYPNANLEIEKGVLYQLIGFPSNCESAIKTSRIKQIWVDSSGLGHAITKSGSHYTF